MAQKEGGRYRGSCDGTFRFPHNLMLSKAIVQALCYLLFFLFAVFFFAPFFFFAIVCYLHMAYTKTV